MFRRRVVLALGGYDESCPGALDYDLWARLVGHGRIVVLPEIGMRYRVHDESLTASRLGRQLEVGQRVARRMLGAYLGRALSEHEVKAITHAWRTDAAATAVDPRLANAILREAYAIFCRTNDAHACRVVRRFTAGRLMGTAVILLRNGDVANALRHSRQAFGWDAGGAISRLLKVPGRLVKLLDR
jgi:hypothetical protein